MTNSTLPVNCGALPVATLTIRSLVDEDTGEVRLWVLKGIARREALRTWGAITPRSLRAAVRATADQIPEMQCAWRQRRGLPIVTTLVTAFGPARDGVRRSAF
jgi:hypothetical protein